jgi:hypothetical protein
VIALFIVHSPEKDMVEGSKSRSGRHGASRLGTRHRIRPALWRPAFPLAIDWQLRPRFFSIFLMDAHFLQSMILLRRAMRG